MKFSKPFKKNCFIYFRQTTMAFEHPYHKELIRLEQYIRDHLQDELSIAHLAEVIHLSQYHFHRVFKAMVGEAVHEYVTRIRMESAAMKLKFSAAKIRDIAFDVGYRNPETFNRAFLRVFKCTPSEFRLQQQDIVAHRIDQIIQQRLISQAISTTIKKMPDRTVAFLVHKGPYHTVGATWQQLMAALPKEELGPLLGISYNDPNVSAAEQIRYDACVQIREDYDPPARVERKVIPGGLFVETLHRGAASGIDDTYHLLYGLWLPHSKYTLRDSPPIEVYLKDLGHYPAEEALTAIYLPIQLA